MANIRVAASTGAPNPFTIPGTNRTYTCSAGSILDVTEYDALELCNAGWTMLTLRSGKVGPTSSRPTNPKANEQYTDTTVGAMVVYDGVKNWLHHYTGAIS